MIIFFICIITIISCLIFVGKRLIHYYRKRNIGLSKTRQNAINNFVNCDSSPLPIPDICYTPDLDYHKTRGEKLLERSGADYTYDDIHSTIYRNRELRDTIREIEKLKAKVLSLKGNIGKLKKSMEEKNQDNIKLQEMLRQSEERTLINSLLNVFDIDVAESLIASYKRYSKVSNATEKYSDNLASYWISIYCSLKNKQFELISSKYKGPSISTVKRWLSNKNIPKIEDFENIDNLENILSFWYKLYHQKYPSLINHTETTTVNLSIDATKIKEMFKIKDNQYIGIMEEGKRIVDNFDFRYKFEPSKYQELVSRLVSNNYLYSHCFVFLFCPFKMVKPFPIHISFTNNGFASEDILRKIQAIQSFRNSNFKVISTSTDADVKYDSMQNDFYKKWKAMLDNNVQINTHEKIMMYPNDGAHIL